MSRRFRPPARRCAALLLFVLPFCVPLLPGWGQQMHRNSFEGHQTLWEKGPSDAEYEQTLHAMSEQGHDGQRSEYLQINAKRGNYVYYQYRTAHAPVADELSIGLWVKANRPNVQLLARVVLPKEQNPNNLNDRLTTYLRGSVYTTVGRWQRLQVGRIVSLTKQQQQMMQAQYKRAVDFTDAYVDMLVLNVYTGIGTSEVWIDELEMGPVLDTPAAQPKPVAVTQPVSQPKLSGPVSALVQYSGGQILVGERPFLFRGIRHTDTPIRTLRDAGFNTLFVEQWTPDEITQAVQNGFYLVPTLPVPPDNPQFVSETDLGREVRLFPDGDHVLFWNLGNALAQGQAGTVARGAQMIRNLDRMRPLSVNAWSGLKKHSGNVNLLGVHRWPLMTMLDPLQYRDWLEQRTRLADAGTYMWTWVQTHLPDHYTQLLYDRPAAAGFSEPIGPQPEQIRLLTYTALGAGCKGVAYWSDRFLADSHQGRDRLLTVALLNQELALLEPLLAKVTDPPLWIDTSSYDVKAAVMRTKDAVLVLPVWMGGNSQFVPGQSAFRDLTLTVPQVPQSWQAWEVSPADARSYLPKRVPMGVQVKLHEFGLTAAVVFTADSKTIVRFQEQARDRREKAAEWTYDLAVKELEKVEVIEAQLEKLNHKQPDAALLLKDAHERLETARKHYTSHLYGEAYYEAQRALRPVRILMRAQWDKAIKTLTVPVASPYAVSYYTLPRHVEFMDQVKKSSEAANQLASGNFENGLGEWSAQEVTLDEVDLKAELVEQVWTRPPAEKKKGPDGKELPPPPPPLPPPVGSPVSIKIEPPTPKKFGPPQEGKRCLMLQVKPKTPLTPPEVLDSTYVAYTSPPMHLPPGSLVKIIGSMNVPDRLQGSVDGALFFDSAGGEPLAVRRGLTNGWERHILYRRVPASGVVTVTVGLTGIGTAFFDDVRVEPLIVTQGETPPASTPMNPAGIATRGVPVPVVPVRGN